MSSHSPGPKFDLAWPHPKESFKHLIRELEEIKKLGGNPFDRLGVIDLWISWLFHERARIELKELGTKAKEGS